ncbi:MAG: hypothetical protein IJZ00_05395 [Lachnospiraceae bacterium]|nr:hypothetical protein [Lachnospiraceae bacterium]
MEYPNIYYKELAERIVKNTTLQLREGEVCFLFVLSNPGVIQSDLYKKMPQYDKNEISNTLYWWEKEGKIRREKSGRSYALFAVNL